jgi:histidine triad (HIT) family protein
MITDPDCIFCKIVAKEIPAHTVYEDSDFVAFLDIHPKAPGHVQIIPKDHYRFVWDVPEAGAYFEITQKIAKVLQKAFGVELIRAQIYGEEVHHAHIWLWADIQKDGTEKDFEAIQQKIKTVL